MIIAFGPRLICLLVAVILLLVAAFYTPTPGGVRPNVTPLGLAFLALALLFP